MMITEKILDGLRADISGKMSPKRFRHTAEVEKTVATLAQLYAPDKALTLRAAALLHDITKEYDTAQQLRICDEYGICVSRQDLLSPKTLHARTAAALIPTLYPDLADDEIVSCVRWHTTGRAGMTLCEKLVYLADYIDMSRTFEDCVKLREYFFGADVYSMSMAEREEHLRRTLIYSYDMTVSALIADGAPISVDTLEARNELVVGGLLKK